MCGIAGYYSLNNTFSEKDIRLMADKLSHRGPDAEGFFMHELVGLAHKRLSIIDLSQEANQPMTSKCGRYVLVYNGEIYNYLDLRKEFQEKHHINFRTNSDTEVILEGFAVSGTEIFHKLCGMFAIALWDKLEKTLYLCRDRIGIKPLYLFKQNNNFAFSSELKSLQNTDFIKNSISLDYNAINTYLHLGYIPEPLSIYNNISKFPSGFWASIKEGNISYNKYWDVEKVISNNALQNEYEAKKELKELLRRIIKEHLICDVSFGAFLSGGIDSSLVTAMASEISEKTLHTFCIGFKENKYNESKFASQVANHLGTHHNELFVSEKDALNLIPQISEFFDEPFADSSAIPTYLVSKLTRKHVTMALSGDGGDELFMGYGAYLWTKRLQKPIIEFLRYPISKTLKQMGSRFKRIAHMFEYDSSEHLKTHIFSQEQYYFCRGELKEILNPDFTGNISIKESIQNTHRVLTPEEAQALFDIKYYLKDDLLVKVDRTSMQHALEVRVPLLDHRLVEFALNLSPNLRLNGKTTKYLLKEVLYDYVPKAYFNRPKWGFSIPLGQWMKNDLKDYTKDMLSPDIIKRHGILNVEAVQKLLKQFENKNYAYKYNRIWTLVILNQFLEKHNSI